MGRIALVLALTALAVAAAPARAGWSAPERVAGPSDSEDGIAWHLAGNERGGRMVVYDASDGVHAVFAPPGGAFAPGEFDVPDSLEGEPYAAALDERGGAAVAWSYFQEALDDPYCCDRIAVSSRRPGRAFAQRRTITPDDQETLWAQIAVNPAGDMAVLGHAADGIHGVFGRAGALGRVEEPSCCSDGLVVDDRGRTEMAYPTGKTIRSIVRSPGGGLAQRVLHRSRRPIAAAEFVGDANGIRTALWLELTSPNETYPRYRIAVALRRGTATFGRPRYLTRSFDGNPAPFTSLAGARSGAAVAAWSPTFGEGEVVRAVVRRPGRAFGRVQTLRSEGYGARLTGLGTAVSRSGRAFVAWTAVLPEGSTGVFAATAAPGRPFGRPRLLSRTGTGFVERGVDVVVDRAGRATVAWQQGQEIRAAQFRP